MTTPTKTGRHMSPASKEKLSLTLAANRSRINRMFGPRMELERRLCPDLGTLPMTPYRRP